MNDRHRRAGRRRVCKRPSPAVQRIATAGGSPATARRVPLEQSPCAVTVASGAVLEVADAGRHPWLCDLPVVARVHAQGIEAGDKLGLRLVAADPESGTIAFEPTPG